MPREKQIAEDRTCTSYTTASGSLLLILPISTPVLSDGRRDPLPTVGTSVEDVEIPRLRLTKLKASLKGPNFL